MLIKICGIKEAKTALFAAENGADFIGFIMSPGFSRSVTIDQAKEIACAAKKGGAEPVAVFVRTEATEIESICDQLNVRCVQAYELKEPLIESLHRFYVNDHDAVLRPHRDFLLIEGDRPGQGKKVEISEFSPPRKRPWLIAGGLTPENIKETILQMQPDGVDVSSGVEENGMKSLQLILKFIQQVKSCESSYY